MIVFGEKLCDIEELFKYPALKVEKDLFYILDNNSYVIHIYSRETKKLIKTFGRKGEGPEEFKMNISWSFLPDTILISSTGKLSYFSKKGELLKELRFDPDILRILAVENFVVGSEYERLKDQKLGDRVIKIIDPLISRSVELLRRKPKDVIHFREGMPKQDMKMIRSYPWYDSNGELVAIGNPDQGFDFKFYNKKGDLVSKFNYEYKKMKITDKIKKIRLEEFKKRLGKRYESHKKRFNYVFPKYFPPFHSFKLSNERLYVFTHLTGDNDTKRELYVMDFKGNLINKTFIPRHPYSIYEGKFYYLVENTESEMWELHMHDL